MRTGPAVTLQVAKFGASYHGLEALLREPTPEKTTGDENRAGSNGDGSALYCVVDLGPSERLRGGNGRRKDQTMQRSRQLYLSNPNVADFRLEDGDERADPNVRGDNISSVSSTNLCADAFQREYLTLPNPKSKDRTPSESQQTFKMSCRTSDGQSARTSMRQALSQDDLSVDSGRPLVDKRQSMWPRRNQDAPGAASPYSSFPVRPSVSAHDILSDQREQHGGRTSAAGVWRAPFSQQPTPTPLIQPVRIDIPVTRAAAAQSNPPLTTFQRGSSSPAARANYALQVSGQKQSHIYACPMSAVKKLPRPSPPSQMTDKPRVSIPPTKHVSFQEPPPQQEKTAGPARPEDLEEPRDPRRREAQEVLEEQRRLRAVENLGQEVQELQAKARRTAEENDRLRKLSVEWQFQKRVREMQQRGEDEEDDEDLDPVAILQQLGYRTSQRGSEQNQVEEQTRSRLSLEEDKANTDQTSSELKQNVRGVASNENQEKVKRVSAPERLTFRERQRLFSLASSA